MLKNTQTNICESTNINAYIATYHAKICMKVCNKSNKNTMTNKMPDELKLRLNNYQNIKLSHTMTLWKKEIGHMLRIVTIILIKKKKCNNYKFRCMPFLKNKQTGSMPGQSTKKIFSS